MGLARRLSIVLSSVRLCNVEILALKWKEYFFGSNEGLVWQIFYSGYKC